MDADRNRDTIASARGGSTDNRHAHARNKEEGRRKKEEGNVVVSIMAIMELPLRWTFGMACSALGRGSTLKTEWTRSVATALWSPARTLVAAKSGRWGLKAKLIQASRSPLRPPSQPCHSTMTRTLTMEQPIVQRAVPAYSSG